MHERFGDLIRVVRTTAPHNAAVAEELATSISVGRQAFVPIAKRLAPLGALRLELRINDAVDVFWFYFGYESFFTACTSE